ERSARWRGKWLRALSDATRLLSRLVETEDLYIELVLTLTHVFAQDTVAVLVCEDDTTSVVPRIMAFDGYVAVMDAPPILDLTESEDSPHLHALHTGQVTTVVDPHGEPPLVTLSSLMVP